jgi:hypothetical protein
VGRVIGESGTFLTGDLPISSGAGEHQVDPAIALLSKDEVVITWASYRQESETYNVFARRFSTAGVPLGPEFRVNQSVGLGRRSPSVAALPDGRFLIVWVAERQVGVRDNRDSQGRVVPGTGSPKFEVALYGRSFDRNGNALSGDQPLSGAEGIAAHPSIAPLPNQNYLVVWSRRDSLSRSNSYDIVKRVIGADASAMGTADVVNHHLYGDQYKPSLAPTGRGVLVVWSSLGQDGSWEGVYGRWTDADGIIQGDELRINTTTAGGQIHPTASAGPSGQLLVAWSMNQPRTGMEIFGQSLATGGELPTPAAPFVTPISSSSIMASWPKINSLEVAAYRVYAEDGVQLAELADNHWKKDGLAPSSRISLQISYVLKTGEVSPRSPSGSATTWGQDDNYDGLPDDWQAIYWSSGGKYPSGSEDSDADGMSNLAEWLAGTNPVEPGSRLQVTALLTALGLRLEWGTQPGFVYQPQSSLDGKLWKNVGGPRFAAGSSDAMTIAATGDASLFRVLRVR